MSVSVNDKVEIFFDLSATGGDYFTLDDATKGKLDDTTYVLAGDVAVDVSEYVESFNVDRGRSREFDEIYAGSASVTLYNYDSRFLPDEFFTSGVLTDENGAPLLDENGGTLYDENGPTLPYGSGNITPGRRIRISTAGVVIFDGRIEAWRPVYDGSLWSRVAVIAEDALGALGRRRFNAWTTTASQTAGERLADVLDRAEVDWGVNRALDAGVSTLQADNVTYGSNVLNYCQLVAKSDLGRLFADRQGVLTFKDRHNLVGTAAAVVLADDGSGVKFDQISPSLTTELLYTDVSVDREGGIAQTVTSSAARAKYDIRRLDVDGLLLDSDTQASEMAAYLLGIYSAPQPRIEQLAITIDDLTTTEQAQVAMLDLANVVSIVWTPQQQSAQFAADFVVEGVSHSTSDESPRVIVVRLSPVQQAEAFVLDDTVLGVLDSGVLAF